MFPKFSVLLVIILAPVAAFAQGTSRIAVVDFERAVYESTEGRKALEQINAEVETHRTEIEKKQTELEEAQNTLRTQERALSAARQSELTRQIDRLQTELARLNEDAQREINMLQQELLGPVADIAAGLLDTYGAEQGYTVIFDTSSPGIIFASPAADITTELIRRLDAELERQAQQTPAQQTPAQETPAPQTPAPQAPPQ